jgi:Sel1 repeat.
MARLELDSPELLAGGHAGAADLFYQLGIAYAIGRNVEVDLVAAHKWLNLAAFRGNAEAAAYRKELSGEMSAGQIAEAQRAAREWLTLH